MLLRLLAPVLLWALTCALPAIAGMEKESHSTRGGLFFAMVAPDAERVLARFDDQAQLEQLAAHCNAGKVVFALQAGAKYQCKVDVLKSLAGRDDEVYVVATALVPPPKLQGNRYLLFALTPPATPRWDVRKIDPEHRIELQAFLQSDTRRFGGLLRQLKLDAATLIRQPKAGAGRPDVPATPGVPATPDARETLVVPGKVVRDAAAFYEAQRHHVFVRNQGAYAYMGEVPGAPESYVDIDGNDLPGLVVSEGCDGWCISLWGLKGGLRPVGSFGGH